MLDFEIAFNGGAKIPSSVEGFRSLPLDARLVIVIGIGILLDCVVILLPWFNAALRNHFFSIINAFEEVFELALQELVECWM